VYDATESAQKALSCVYRTGQRFGVVHLVDVLRGVATERVQQFRHDHVSTFGIGADHDEKTWRSVFRQLIAAGLLDIDIDGYGALRLTAASRGVLKGDQRVALRRDLDRARPARRRKTAPGATPGAAAGVDAAAADADPALFERLRAWRAQAAREQGVPAYVILHDRTLHAIAARQPRTLDDLAAISGIGAHKLERYGTALLQTVAG
jgi:ATP-dependent DNA helicase RecQ